jgi:hypothetical protein
VLGFDGRGFAAPHSIAFRNKNPKSFRPCHAPPSKVPVSWNFSFRPTHGSSVVPRVPRTPREGRLTIL